MVNDNTETTSQAARHTAQALRLEWWCLGCGFKNTIRRASLSNRSLSLKPHQIQKLCTLIDSTMRECLTIPCIYHIDNHFILRLNYRWLLVEFPQWNGNHLYVLSWLWLSITVDGWRHNIFLQTLNRALFFFFFFFAGQSCSILPEPFYCASTVTSLKCVSGLCSVWTQHYVNWLLTTSRC